MSLQLIVIIAKQSSQRKSSGTTGTFSQITVIITSRYFFFRIYHQCRSHETCIRVRSIRFRTCPLLRIIRTIRQRSAYICGQSFHDFVIESQTGRHIRGNTLVLCFIQLTQDIECIEPITVFQITPIISQITQISSITTILVVRLFVRVSKNRILERVYSRSMINILAIISFYLEMQFQILYRFMTNFQFCTQIIIVITFQYTVLTAIIQ